MKTAITILLILALIVSVNGILSYISLKEADAAAAGLSVNVIDNQKASHTSTGNIAGEGGDSSPFSLYPLNLKDVSFLYAVYSPDTFPAIYTTQLKKQFNNFSYEIMGRLAACYGTLYYYLEKQASVPDYLQTNDYLKNIATTLLGEYMNYKTVHNIMYAAYTDLGEDYEGWLWAEFFEKKDYNTWWEFNGSNAMAFIENSSGETDEVNSLYCAVLECNLYEVMLGERITEYPSTREALAERINELSAQYMQRTEYLGFSENDADIIADYILKHIIGISNKNGLAVFNLIKSVVFAQMSEAVSAKRDLQLAGKGFSVKSLLSFVEVQPTEIVNTKTEINGASHTLKFLVINSKLARSFNALPIFSYYKYSIFTVENGEMKTPLLAEKYYYNKWFYISPGFKVAPLTVQNIENYTLGELLPTYDCIILIPKQTVFKLYADPV